MNETANGRATEQGDLVLGDYVKFGVRGVYSVSEESALQLLRTRLRSAGILKLRQRDLAPGCIEVDMPVIGDVGEVMGDVKAVLHFEARDEHLSIAPHSTIEFNLMQALREKHGIDEALVGQDGKRNVAGPTDRFDLGDVEHQFEFAAAGVMRLFELIDEALPEGSIRQDATVWLRAAEVCHDLTCEQPADITRAVTHTATPGARLGDHDEYRARKSIGRVPVAHWRGRQQGETIKVYPKTADLLRIEVACHSRTSVASCVGDRASAAIETDAIFNLLVDFYDRAGEVCCAALDHVRVIGASPLTPADLIAALQPLAAIVQGERAGTGYTPSARAIEDARRIYNELCADGLASARGLRRGTKVRDTLEAMTGPEGPLARGRTRGIYCLKPEFGRAAWIMAPRLKNSDQARGD